MMRGVYSTSVDIDFLPAGIYYIFNNTKLPKGVNYAFAFINLNTHEVGYGSLDCVQICISDLAVLYTRVCKSGTWSSWYIHAGDKIVDV